MKTSDIKGIIPPVITPMNNDPEQTVNHEALRQQVERLLAGGVHGMFPLGTNGEAYALSFKEKEEILATVIDQVKGRVPVYAGTGCRNWRRTGAAVLLICAFWRNSEPDKTPLSVRGGDQLWVSQLMICRLRCVAEKRLRPSARSHCGWKRAANAVSARSRRPCSTHFN